MNPARRLLHPGQVSVVLPREARAALQAASEVEPHKGRGESQLRNETIARETARIRSTYPGFFRQEGATVATA